MRHRFYYADDTFEAFCYLNTHYLNDNGVKFLAISFNLPTTKPTFLAFLSKNKENLHLLFEEMERILLMPLTYKLFNFTIDDRYHYSNELILLGEFQTLVRAEWVL